MIWKSNITMSNVNIPVQRSGYHRSKHDQDSRGGEIQRRLLQQQN